MDNGKIYIRYDDIHQEVERLYLKMKDANYVPDYIIAIGTGGFIPARILRSYLDIPIICMTVGFYGNDDKLQKKKKKVQMIEKNSLEHQMIKGKKIIVIDELDDTRTTLPYIINLLLELEPAEISVGVLHNKKKEKEGKLDRNNKYFSGKMIEDRWVVYPWETTNIVEHNQLCKNTF